MSRILVQLTTGPENPTRAALGFLVARTAAAEGHEVTMFLAGDAVGLLRDATMDATVGIGTGSVREHYTALAEAGVRVFASGMSSKRADSTPLRSAASPWSSRRGIGPCSSSSIAW